MASKGNCAICSKELKFLNTPVARKGVLSDGSMICTKCFGKVNNINPWIASKLNGYNLPDILLIIKNVGTVNQIKWSDKLTPDEVRRTLQLQTNIAEHNSENGNNVEVIENVNNNDLQVKAATPIALRVKVIPFKLWKFLLSLCFIGVGIPLITFFGLGIVSIIIGIVLLVKSFPKYEDSQEVKELKLFVENNIVNGLNPKTIPVIVKKAQEIGYSEYSNESTLRKKFDSQILLWELNNGIIPQVTPNIILQSSETCLYKKSCSLYERKEVTTRINYSGPSGRIKIAKGVSYKMGSIGVSRTKELQDVLKGKGEVHLTNKRIIFSSSTNNVNISFGSIVDIETGSDAVVIHKSTGRPFIFEVNDSQRFSLLLRYSLGQLN